METAPTMFGTSPDLGQHAHPAPEPVPFFLGHDRIRRQVEETATEDENKTVPALCGTSMEDRDHGATKYPKAGLMIRRHATTGSIETAAPVRAPAEPPRGASSHVISLASAGMSRTS